MISTPEAKVVPAILSPVVSAAVKSVDAEGSAVGVAQDAEFYNDRAAPHTVDYNLREKRRESRQIQMHEWTEMRCRQSGRG